MKKIMSLLFGISLTAVLYAGTIVKPNTYTAGTIIDPSQVNANDDTIYSEFNGNIENVNVKADAAIAASKLNLSSIAEDVTITTTDGDVLTLDNSSSGNDPLIVKDNGTTIFTVQDGGGVTIGTTSVDGKLHVVRNASGAGAVSAVSDADDLVVEDNQNTGISILSPNGLTGSLVFGDTDDNDVASVAYIHTSSAMVFTVAAAERMRIDSTGNIGIGTTTPLGKVHIYTSNVGSNPAANADDLALENASDAGMTILSGSSSDGRISFGDSGTSAQFSFIYDHDEDDMSFYNNSVGSIMTLVDGGNVGIGTTTPKGLVHIFGGSAAAGALSSSANELVLENSGDVGMTFRNPSGNSAYITFVDENSGTFSGYIRYDHVTDSMTFRVADVRVVMEIGPTGFVHVNSVGNADTDLEVSDGSSLGAGTVHAANYDNHSSEALKSDIRDLTQNEKIEARNAVKNLNHVEFRYKVIVDTTTGRMERDPNAALNKGLIFEDAPASIHGHVPGTLSLGNRIINLEIAVQYLIDENNNLKERVDALEALQP